MPITVPRLPEDQIAYVASLLPMLAALPVDAFLAKAGIDPSALPPGTTPEDFRQLALRLLGDWAFDEKPIRVSSGDVLVLEIL